MNKSRRGIGIPIASAALAFWLLQGCYTRLYTGAEEIRTQSDSLEYLMDSAAGSDTLRTRDRIIINRYYDQRRYRGYPFEEWDDPFFHYRTRPLLRGYWQYYYDPYWDYRRSYRGYRPYHPYRPRPPAPGPRPDAPGPSQGPSGDGASGPDLYNPPPAAPPPQRGKRREEPQEPAQGRSAEEPPPPGQAAPRDSGSGDGQAIPPPARGKRR